MTTSVATTTERETMVRSLSEKLDRRDVEAFGACLAPDAQLVLGNMPPMVGREAICEGNTAFLFSIAGIHHGITGIWEGAGCGRRRGARPSGRRIRCVLAVGRSPTGRPIDMVAVATRLI